MNPGTARLFYHTFSTNFFEAATISIEPGLHGFGLENKVAHAGGVMRECSSYLMKIAARVEYEKRAYESVGNKRDDRRVEQDGQEPLVDLEL